MADFLAEGEDSEEAASAVSQAEAGVSAVEARAADGKSRAPP